MRLLALHSDFIEYEITKETSAAEELPDKFKKDRMKEVLAIPTMETISQRNPYIAEDGNGQKVMTLNELLPQICEKTKGMPLRPLALPTLFSKRPKFR